jgi:hypothetical protein
VDDRQVNDEVLAQLGAMAADPKSWRRFRVFEIYCGACNKLMAEVMRTSHGLVVVYRSFQGVTAAAAPIVGKFYESQAMSKRAWRMLHNGPFICFCDCTRAVLEEGDFTDPIGKGQRRIIRRRTST